MLLESKIVACDEFRLQGGMLTMSLSNSKPLRDEQAIGNKSSKAHRCVGTSGSRHGFPYYMTG